MMSKIKEWFIKFMNKLGFYTDKQVLERCIDNNSNYEKIIDTMKGDMAKLKEEVHQLSIQNLDLNMQNKRLVDAPFENQEYIKDLQTQLGDILHVSPCFEFSNDMAIPGSTCIVTGIEDDPQGDERFTVVRGRTVLTDDMTPLIDQTKSIEDRMSLLMDYMKRWGLCDRIVRDLMSYGALSVSLAYNKNCTAYEMYYQLSAVRITGSATFTINDSVKYEN